VARRRRRVAGTGRRECPAQCAVVPRFAGFEGDGLKPVLLHAPDGDAGIDVLRGTRSSPLSFSPWKNGFEVFNAHHTPLQSSDRLSQEESAAGQVSLAEPPRHRLSDSKVDAGAGRRRWGRSPHWRGEPLAITDPAWVGGRRIRRGRLGLARFLGLGGRRLGVSHLFPEQFRSAPGSGRWANGPRRSLRLGANLALSAFRMRCVLRSGLEGAQRNGMELLRPRIALGVHAQNAVRNVSRRGQ
jgi:hypothetical protein